MTPQRAAAILSFAGHRGENRWWVQTQEEFLRGKPIATTVWILSHGQKLETFEGIAIASFYLLDAETAAAFPTEAE